MSESLPNFKAGEPQAADIIARARTVCLPTIVLGELRAGFRLGKHQERNESELQAFLLNSAVRIMEVDEEASYHYAEIFAELRRRGTPVPTNDMWIAALAVRDGATILTFDEHFEFIRRVGTHLLRGS
ncbi:MAG TPA: type II toxin-antitoxin system VapC family toxin [Candidatus Obscuribacterales bacterium]